MRIACRGFCGVEYHEAGSAAALSCGSARSIVEQRFPSLAAASPRVPDALDAFDRALIAEWAATVRDSAAAEDVVGRDTYAGIADRAERDELDRYDLIVVQGMLRAATEAEYAGGNATAGENLGRAFHRVAALVGYDED